MSSPAPSSTWDSTPLSHLAFYHNGLAFKPSDWVEEGVKIIRIEQLNNPEGDYDYYAGQFPEINRIENGDLIFSWSATLKVAIWKHGNGVLNQHLFKVVPKDGVNKRFLLYILDHNMDALAGGSQGSTMRHIKRGELDTYTVRVPRHLPEQRKIAKILTTADELIEKTEALIAKYEAIKQGMMHELFTRGVDKQGRLRPRYDEAPQLYKESELGWIPKEWEAVVLGLHLPRIEQGWSPDCESEAAAVGEWGILKTTAVVWAGYDDSANKKLPKHLAPRPEYEVHVGDVLMTRGGPNSRVGVVAIVGRTQGRIMMSDKIYRLKADSTLDPAFLTLALSSDSTQIHLSSLKTGLAESQTNISQEIVRRLRIVRPPLDEQVRIRDRISGINRKTEAERSQLSKLHPIKSGLMQDLITGEVRVKVDVTEGVPARV